MSAMEQDQTNEQTGSLRRIQIKLRVPHEDFDMFRCKRLTVHPADSVDVLDRKFPLADMFFGDVPADLQQIFLNGDSLIYEDHQTFDEVGILEGDTIFLLMAPKDMYINVHNVTTHQEVSLFVPPFITLARLKKLLHEDFPVIFSYNLIAYEQLIYTRYGGPYLESITLAHWNVRNQDTVYVDIVHYDISVITIAYGKTMEREIFLPHDTVSTIKDRIGQIQASRNPGVRMKATTPALVRAAIRNRNGTLVYLCFHLYGEEMKLHMDESTHESLRPIYNCVLQNRHTVEDIYRIIEKEDGYKLDCTPREKAKDCIFDYTWTGTFAPQIDVDPVAWSDDKLLPLYFLTFVLHEKITRHVDSLCTVRNFVESVCEKENMRGVERELCSPETCEMLKAHVNLFRLHALLSLKFPVILLRRERPLYQREMKVYVQWPGSLDSPTEVIVEPDDTVISLKDQIEKIFTLPMPWQKLVSSGKTLADNHALISSFGIQEGSIVEIRSNLEDEPAVNGENGT